MISSPTYLWITPRCATIDPVTSLTKRFRKSRNGSPVRAGDVVVTPTDLKSNAIKDISGALNILLADMFTLYLSDTSLPCSERLAP